MRSTFALLTALAVGLAACGPTPSTEAPSPATSATDAAATLPCQAHVETGVIPTWARNGFSDPEPVMPHALAADGGIVALIFGVPLSAPPAADHSNKILWVSNPDAASASPDPSASTSYALHIRAQRMDGAAAVGVPVERQVDGGPGPSTIDVPEPGCWRLALAWGDHRDTIDLEYVAPS